MASRNRAPPMRSQTGISGTKKASARSMSAAPPTEEPKAMARARSSLRFFGSAERSAATHGLDFRGGPSGGAVAGELIGALPVSVP